MDAFINAALLNVDPHAQEASLRSAAALLAAQHNASKREEYLDQETVIGVGFGYAAITCNGVPVFEENGQSPDELPTAADAEAMASKEPAHDWRVHLITLREERHYRREGDGRWRLYRRGYGLS
ncbi:MAG: hypothetical protein WCA12_02110 [Burkholderiales bacterium]